MIAMSFITKHRFSIASAAGATVIVAACAGGAIYGAQHPATASADVPADFAAYTEAGGEQCDAVDGALLAGVLDVSSGFDTDVTSPAGAQGPAQLLPATWAVIGAQVDETGATAGIPGSGNPFDPGDATMALSRVLCKVAADQAPQISSGDLAGDARDLMLAGFIAGEDAVTTAGGVPEIADVPEQVAAINEAAATYQ